LENKKRTPWRRWVVLVLMIVGFIVGRIIVPVQPEISFAPEKLFDVNLPLVGTFSIVNTLPTLVVTIILIWILAFFTNRAMKQSLNTDLVPRGVGGIMEAFLELLYNLTEGSAGAKYAPLIFPWFATIMVYVLFANLLKLLPGFETIGILHLAHGEGNSIQPLGTFLGFDWANLLPAKVESGYILAPFFRGISVDLNFTVALALISVVMIQVVGFRAQGIGYLSKFFNTRTMFKNPFFGPMDFLVGLLELISELSKILSFAFRLFGNMFAGVVLVAVVPTMLGAALYIWTGGIVPSMLMLFELFVGSIQAFVFGMLTMVFMAMATQGHGHEEEHAE
jgi:F-type H+-transporting ATPase subunit a